MHKPLPKGPLTVRIEYRMAGAIGAFEHTYRTIQVTAGMTWEDVSEVVRREFPYDRYDHVHLRTPFHPWPRNWPRNTFLGGTP